MRDSSFLFANIFLFVGYISAETTIPPVCKGLGEIAVLCTKQCQPTCDTITGAKPEEICVPDGKCTPGCDCLPGFFRNALNICLVAENCLCPKANYRVVNYPNPCPGGTCESPEFLQCNTTRKEYGCQCKTGRVKDEKGNCILIETCPPKCEGKNEESSPCTDNCPLTCKGITSNNPEQENCYPAPCVAGCNCAPGFSRNVKGVCVKPGNCRCGDPNAEVVSCPNPCPGGTCDSPNFSICTEKCKTYGCQCKKGFVKNSKGNCVLLSQCPLSCEGKNEESSPCTDNCPLTCKGITSNNPEQGHCYPPPCVAGCNCAPGFARNVKGVCIKPGNCQCGDPNAEVVKCPNPCPGGTCEDPEKSNCKLRCKAYGCQCKKGFVKDSDGKCILLSKCVPVCEGPGEIAVPCRNQCQPTCDSMTSNKPQEICVPDSQCIPGCGCLPGYLRNSSNICIKAESCLCPVAYMQVVPCPNPCPGGTCDIPEFLDCNAPCKEYGCQCKEGRVKNEQGNCVQLEYCPLKCKGKNEVSTLCKDSCPLTCKGIIANKPEQQGCFLGSCVAGCDCALGFARNVNGVCIKTGNCRCGDPNAEVVPCPSPCLGGTCELPNFTACTELCAAYGCQCKQDFVKDSTGKCIHLSECPSQ